MSKEIVTVEQNLRSQIVISSKKHRGGPYRPNAFTEQGVVMGPPKKPRRQIGFHVQEKRSRYRTGNRR